MTGSLVAGVDSSTQSTKVVLCRAEDGTVVAEASAPHPDGTECHPDHWWAALSQVRELLERADAVAVAAQQHGMVALDGAGDVVRPALLWNDTRSAPQARALVAELGGPKSWAERTGSVPLASFTVTKLRWMAEHEPGNARRTERVMLPHDWLTLRLGAREPVTDRGDASGTGYWSPATGAYLPELLRAALGHDAEPPRVAAPGERVGETAWGAALGPGTGDNMGAALGLGLRPGDVVVSIGTSGTAFAVAADPAADPSGLVAGFADATGRFLPLVCTLNAARILSAAAAMTGASLDELSALALAAGPGAGGVTLLPYLDGERTPDRPDATGVLAGLTTANATRENLARAAVEALLCSLADAVDHLAAQGVRPRRTLLIGGGARSAAVRALAPAILGTPVTVPEPAEYVALGAARQAAWVLAGTPEPPAWPAPPATEHTSEHSGAEVRERYAALRDSAPQI
ncbi:MULTISPECIES: xylulokinase [Actinomadura]|uniref:Xylulose kinase n=1 Tax=Actinomadura madurae TaxID=1993 RepID=A0A1I5H6T7_9ACTN|nr:xylulokinase [Actinomadura madurae]SFO43919.1 xylulokinase [Actinomadura madurae]SPT57571.1 Xylulose kinase [Actinomadura madurae]